MAGWDVPTPGRDRSCALLAKENSRGEVRRLDGDSLVELFARLLLMIVLFLTFGLAVLLGLTTFAYRRGPRAIAASPAEPPAVSLPEAAVLRDGAVGATRWAFAAIIVKLARDGHCTLVRTRKRRWLHIGPAVTVDLHADPTTLSALEKTVLRQLGRHDTIGGFGFAGSTFRRRTLRDVRADLVASGGLADRRRSSNALLALALLLAGAGGGTALLDASALVSAPLVGGALGCAIGAIPRHPVTDAGARRRAAHRAYAERQRDRLQALLPDAPEHAAAVLSEALPALVLERIATPRWLTAVADRLSPSASAPPSWIRDEIDGCTTDAEACRTLAHVLRALGARTSIAKRLTGPLPGP